MKHIPLCILVALALSGCSDDAPYIQDEAPEVDHKTEVKQKPPEFVVKDYTTINKLPCLVTVEGDMGATIRRFEAACGVTPQRYCYEFESGVHQCTNQMESIAPKVTEAVVLTPVNQNPIIISNEDSEVPGINEPDNPPEDMIGLDMEDMESEATTIEDVSVVEPPEFETPEVIKTVNPSATTSLEVIIKSEPVNQDYCAGDDLTREEARAFFKTACANVGFSDVECGDNGWSCAVQMELPDVKPKQKVVKKTVTKPRYAKKKVKKKPRVIDLSWSEQANKIVSDKRAEAKVSFDLIVDMDDITENNPIDMAKEWIEVIDGGGSIWVAGLSDNIMAAVEYILLSRSDVNTLKINIVDSMPPNWQVASSDPLFSQAYTHTNFINVASKDDIELHIEANAILR